MGLFKTPDHVKFKGFFFLNIFHFYFPVHMFNIKESKENQKSRKPPTTVFAYRGRKHFRCQLAALGNKPDQKQTNL